MGIRIAGDSRGIDTPPVRVLLVEDDPDLADVTAEFLRDEGLDVRTALSGREALEAAPAFLPQLVLCDLNLPDINGLEVARALRSNTRVAPSYIVLLTAMPRQARTDAELTEQGADCFLSKPITIEAIRSVVDRIERRDL